MTIDLPKNAPSSRPSSVGSVVQAITILRYLGPVPDGRGVNAIARDLGISPSSCFNLVKTLAAERLLQFDSATKRYTLGPGLAELAQPSRSESILSAVSPAMRDIADRFDVACGLWRRAASGRLILVALSESVAATRIHMVVGQRQPLYAGAAGRAVAAATGASHSDIAEGLAAVRWQESPDLKHYLTELETTRRRGWALDRDQLLRGVTSVAAAIDTADGTARFILSCTMFSGQHDDEAIDAIGEATREAADHLTSPGVTVAPG
jgi:DNA-binding IclR family transcriptional regulator